MEGSWLLCFTRFINAVSKKLKGTRSPLLATVNLNTEKSRIILDIQRGLTIAKKLNVGKSDILQPTYETMLLPRIGELIHAWIPLNSRRYYGLM